MIQPPLHAGHLDRVHLRVRSIETTAAFYVAVLGLERRDAADDRAVLSPPGRGAGPTFRLVLTGDPEAVPTSGSSVGLYHFALLYPDRTSLAGAVCSVLESGWKRIDGASDHGVSEAFYLRDPEGNGVELYRDRPRDEWEYTEDGSVKMITRPLDVQDLLNELEE
jgi:catechol 2,3-dioxygenase